MRLWRAEFGGGELGALHGFNPPSVRRPRKRPLNARRGLSFVGFRPQNGKKRRLAVQTVASLSVSKL
jgi:hypothetical protein